MRKNSRHEKAPSAPTLEAHEAERQSIRKNVMSKNNTAVTVDNLPVIKHAGRPVVTTALLAKLYGTDDNNLIKNYQRNADRFVPGKHFHKLEGAELKALKDYMTDSHVVQIPKNTRQMILWTERGAARHAKMLDTEQAWEVFEKMEDSYFGQQSVLAIEHTPEKLSPAHQRHILNRVAELAGMDRKKYPAVWRSIKDHFKVGSYKDIPDSQYPAVCEFILCKPLEGDAPTARIIESDPGIRLDRFEAHHMYLLMSRFAMMSRHKGAMLSAARALDSKPLMDFFDQLNEGGSSFAELDKRRHELYEIHQSFGCVGGYAWSKSA